MNRAEENRSFAYGFCIHLTYIFIHKVEEVIKTGVIEIDQYNMKFTTTLYRALDID